MLRIAQPFAKFDGIVQILLIGRCAYPGEHGELIVQVLQGLGVIHRDRAIE